jgi:hypothetical protein
MVVAAVVVGEVVWCGGGHGGGVIYALRWFALCPFMTVCVWGGGLLLLALRSGPQCIVNARVLSAAGGC